MLLSPMIYTVIGITCVILIGYITHRVGICLVRAVRLVMQGDYSLLLAILMSGLWVGGYVLWAQYYKLDQPFSRFGFHPLFAIGGFIFGLGSSVNQGCSVSTMHQFARGNISMLFTMIGWFIGLSCWLSLSMHNMVTVTYPILPPIKTELLLGMFIASILFTFAMIVVYPKQRERWIGISLIGLLVSVLFYIEPMWTPSKLIQDTGAALFEGKQQPSLFRIALVVMLLIGMWISVVTLGHIKFRKPTIHKLVRHGIAGVLMGFGGAMALGGNDSQVLIGLPMLSLGAITAVIFMLLGISLEQFLYHRGKLFYEKR